MVDLEWIIPSLLSGAAVILLIVLLLKQNKALSTGDAQNDKKFDELNRVLNSEFERSRREMTSGQSEMRRETGDALTLIGQKTEQLRLDTAERSAQQETAMAKAFNAITVNNTEQSEKQNKVISDALEKLREGNEKKLEEMRITVDEKLTSTLSTRLDSSFKTVSDRLESVNKSLGEMKELSNGVTTNVTALNRVLTNVKARGTWAEVQLGAILDQTIPGMYETNFASSPTSADRVEFAVRIPSGDGNVTYLPIDSKFPMEDYIRVCNAADAADAAALDSARKALEVRVLNEAKTVKKYINVPLTTPYAILYLATEGLYAEIMSSKTAVAERIQNEYGIMIAGPSTITALLNSLSLGFRAIAINEKANEVRQLLSAAKQQYDKFGEVLQKARKKIDEAGKSLDEADKRNDIIRKKLGKVEELDSGKSDEILGITENDETLKEENV